MQKGMLYMKMLTTAKMWTWMLLRTALLIDIKWLTNVICLGAGN
jgi:hypothetical protein